MTTTYTWEHDDGNDYEIVIEFKVIAGEPMTWDYPGSPPEVDWHGFTCKAHPEMAAEFEKLTRNNYDLAGKIDEACMEAARDAWEMP
jgi:hypothetical protein